MAAPALLDGELNKLQCAKAKKAQAKAKGKPKTSGKKYRAYMVTTNQPNWQPEINDFIQFVCWQPEHPEKPKPGSKFTERPGWHRQCYVEFKERLSGKSVSMALGHPPSGDHLFTRNDPRFGTQEQAIAYCSSVKYCHDCGQGDHLGFTQEYPWSYEWNEDDHKDCPQFYDKGKVGETVVEGERVGPQGGKRDGAGHGNVQDTIIEAIKDGQSRRHLSEEYSKYIATHVAWFEKMFTLHAPVRRWKPAVYWIWGDAGTDKSRLARAISSEDCYCKPPDSKWFDGYDGQNVLILNDLRKSTFTFSGLLDLLDRYEFRVEIKGGYVPMLAKVIVITCSKPHAQLWSELNGTENENLKQLTRRITEEFHLPADSHSKQQFLYRMRQSAFELQNPANWDVEDEYGSWDGKSKPQVPLAPPFKKARTESTAASSTDTQGPEQSDQENAEIEVDYF